MTATFEFYVFSVEEGTMKSALLLALIVCLVASSLPVTAQEKTETGRLARAITREAVRLAAFEEPTASVVEAVQQSDTPARSDWSCVPKLAPGTEIIVTVKGSLPGTRYFLEATDTGLTILNVTDVILTKRASRALQDMASSRPEYFLAAYKSGTFENNDVRVAGDGVFVAGQKVADLGQVVERIARTDVAEVKRKIALLERSSPGWRFAVPVVAGAYIGVASGWKSNEGGIWGMVGAAIGGALGYRWDRAAGHKADHVSHKTDDVIYRAP